MADTVTVKALRPFDFAKEPRDDRSPPFEVSRTEFAELQANGLVEEAGSGAKAAREPKNKKAAAPENKAQGGKKD